MSSSKSTEESVSDSPVESIKSLKEKSDGAENVSDILSRLKIKSSADRGTTVHVSKKDSEKQFDQAVNFASFNKYKAKRHKLRRVFTSYDFKM